jgi:hypothetical protein
MVTIAPATAFSAASAERFNWHRPTLSALGTAIELGCCTVSVREPHVHRVVVRKGHASTSVLQQGSNGAVQGHSRCEGARGGMMATLRVVDNSDGRQSGATKSRAGLVLCCPGGALHRGCRRQRASRRRRTRWRLSCGNFDGTQSSAGGRDDQAMISTYAMISGVS